MTSAIAVVGLTYDGIDVQSLADGILLEIVVGIFETPVVRGTDTTIPALAGTLAGNRIVDNVAIELRGHICAAASAVTLEDQRASHYDNALIVRQLFRPQRDRAPLVATLPNGTVLTIQARPKNIVSNEVIRGEWTELSVALEGDGDWAAS